MATNTIARHSLVFQSKNLAAAGIDQLRRQLTGLGRQGNQTATQFGQIGNRIRSGLGNLGAILGVGGGAFGAGFAIKLAADAETARVSFETIIGSASEAQKVLGDLKQFSASTPLQLPELQDAARKLLAFGESTDEVVATLRRVGDISAGVGAPIGEIAEIYGKARVQGRLFAEDINQLTGRGIPVIQELAKQFGVAEGEVKKLVESGKVNFQNLEEAFRSLTSEGGKFSGLLAAQAETVAGKYSTLKDNVAALAREFGEVLLPAASAVIETSLGMAQALQTLDATTVRNVAVLGAFAGGFLLTVTVIPRVITGIRLLITTMRTLASAAVLTQALTGVGLAKIVAGVAVGAGAALAASAAFDQLADSSEQAAEANENAKDAVKALDDAAQSAASRSAGMAANAKTLATESEKAAAAHKSIEDSVRRTKQQQKLSVGAVTLNSTEGFSATVGGIQRQLQDRSTRNSDRMVDELAELNSQVDQLVEKPVLTVRKVRF